MKKKEFTEYGYIKKEGKIYTAICVSMSLFGQGKTKKEALKKLNKSIRSYFEYLEERYKKDYRRHLPESLPLQFQEEYDESKKEDRFVVVL